MTPPGHFLRVNDLGLKMLQLMCSKGIPEGGFALSSVSICTALAMLVGAASPVESKRMCDALAFADTEPFDALHLMLKDCNDTTAAANAIFAENGIVVYDEYIDFLARFAAVANTEFSRLIDGLETINSWISDNTMGMIPDMISSDSLAQSHIVLINALSFKGTWEEEFDPQNTKRKYPFHVSETMTRPVEMMFRFNEKILVNETREYTAIRLPYETVGPAGSTSFLAYLPNRNTSIQQVLSAVPRSLNQQGFSRKKFTKFGFPKIEISSGFDVLPLSREIGVHIPTKFPRMCTGNNMVQAILHNTAISLDEKGTRAAASTAVMMTRCAMAPNTLIFDRPFVFLIAADHKGAALFTGVFSPGS